MQSAALPRIDLTSLSLSAMETLVVACCVEANDDLESIQLFQARLSVRELRGHNALQVVSFEKEKLCAQDLILISSFLRGNKDSWALNLRGHTICLCNNAHGANTPEGVMALADLFNHNKALKRVDLRKSGIGREGKLILGRKLMTAQKGSVQELLVDEWHIPEFGESLNLQGLKLGPADACLISGVLCWHASVRILNLSCNRLGSDGLVYLSELVRVNDLLIALDLSSNNLGGYVDRYGNFVRTPAGLLSLAEALKENSHIELLDVRNNHVAGAELVALQQAIPSGMSLVV